MSKLHLSTVHINWSPLYLYWQIIAWKFSDHVCISRVGMAHPDFFQGGWLSTLPSAHPVPAPMRPVYFSHLGLYVTKKLRKN